MRVEELRTPCYVVDRELLTKNLEILKGVADRTGARVLLAQKAFSMFYCYPLIGEYLNGATASGIYEAKLCKEEMVEPLKKKGKHIENHIFSPAFREEDFDDILEVCDHLVFNSIKQVEKFGERAKAAGKSIGLRINPRCSTQEGHEIYDPCAPGSRLGVTLEQFQEFENKDILDGLHFHTLCEQNSDDLETTLNAFEEQFAPYLKNMKWINFGGGHHVTRVDYDIERLEKCIRRMQENYGLVVYIEPGEAIALNAGFLITEILEIQKRAGEKPIAILDTSAACHMPDVLEMPYTPPLLDSVEPSENTITYRLGGPTCLAGDIIGEYAFEKPLIEGQRLTFGDMAIYSMVKNNTFNGMPLPDIVWKDGEECTVVKHFGYEDFKMRLS